MDGIEVLKIPMGANDAEAKTIGEYLKKLLSELWARGEVFSGKRPFGNSGWEYELYTALVRAGAVEGEFDEYGELNEYDAQQAHKAIFAAIDAMLPEQ